MQTSVLTPYGRTITVLQAMPWANLSSLSREVIGTLTVDQLELTNLQEQSFTNSARSLLQSLSDEQILQLSNKTIHGLSREKLMQTNVNGTAVWHVLVLDSTIVDLLPVEFQPRNLTATQVTSLFTHLAQSKTRHALNANVLRTIPTASLVNGILGLEISIARAFITDLSDIQLAAFTPAVVNGLVTSSKDMAAIFLNAGAYGSLSINQFQALLGGATHIGDIHESALSNYLSVRALRSLTPSQITELTASQFAKLLANETLSKVIFNAGQPGAWAMEQLQAVSALAISQMTQSQYLQFSGGLALFSEPQQEAMATNVNLLEIMLTGQTGVWMQDEIAWMVENIPGMIPLASLPGGGNEPNRGNHRNGEDRERLLGHRVSAFQTMTNLVAISAALTKIGWSRLSEEDQNGLLENRYLPTVLSGLESDALEDLLRNATLFPKLEGDNVTALIEPIKRHLRNSNQIQHNIVSWNQRQVDQLIARADQGGPVALSLIARYAPGAIRLTATQVTALINQPSGPRALVNIIRHAQSVVPDGLLTSDNVTALLNVPNGLIALMEISDVGRPVFQPNVVSAETVNLLIRESQLTLLLYFARHRRSVFAVNSLTEENVRMLINSDRGLEILTEIAMGSLNAFNLTAGLVGTLIAAGNRGLNLLTVPPLARGLNHSNLTIENVISLINLEKGPSTLADIAGYSSTALAGVLTPKVVIMLINSAGGIKALRRIAIESPDALIGALDEISVDVLVEQPGGASLLMTIAEKAPVALVDNLFTVDHVRALLNHQDDGRFALGAIATARVAAFDRSVAELSSRDANRLPLAFWQNVSTPLLQAMFESRTLGLTYFDVSSEESNTIHISRENLQAIRPTVLFDLYEKNEEVRNVIINDQKFLTHAQLAIFIAKGHKEFIERENLNVSANNLFLAQPNALSVNNILVEQSASSTNQVELPSFIILKKIKME